MNPISSGPPPALDGAVKAHAEIVPLRLQRQRHRRRVFRLLLCRACLVVLMALPADLSAGRATAERNLESSANQALPAVIGVELAIGDSGLGWKFCGTWVSADGKAIVPLQALAYTKLPRFTDNSREELRLAGIISIDREVEMALVKLKAKPKRWLELAEASPPTGEPVALVWRYSEREGTHQGPVLARRPDIRHPLNSQAVFLGLGMSLGPVLDIRGPMGSPVIDAEGRLVGVYSMTESAAPSHPPMVLAAPVERLRKLVLSNSKAGSVPHPLPFADNRWDAGYWAYQIAACRLVAKEGMADPPRHGREEDLWNQSRDDLLDDLRKRHPESGWLKRTALQRSLERSAALLSEAMADGSPANGVTSPVGTDEFMRNLEAYSKAYGNGAGHDPYAPSPLALRLIGVNFLPNRAEELAKIRKQIAAAQGGTSAAELYLLSVAELAQGNAEAAEKAAREIADKVPDCLYYLDFLSLQLKQAGKFTEADKLSNRIYELERVFRPR